MTTEEKLFVKVFERKNSIIEKVKQQTELYLQHLASKLLIDGITPPAWFWSPDRLSDSKALSKEELITKLLCPRPPPSVHYSVSRLPSYNTQVSLGDNERFTDGVSTGDLAFREGLEMGDGPTVPAQSRDDQEGCALMFVAQRDGSFATKNRTDEKILNVYNAPEESLPPIQRSKSRQKALEIRNSLKELPKSRLSPEKISDICSSELRFSLSAANQGPGYELQNIPEPCVSASRNYEDHDLEEPKCPSSEKRMDLSSVRLSMSKVNAEVPVPVRGSLALGCSCEGLKVSSPSPLAVVSMKGPDLISTSEEAHNYAGKSPQHAGPSTFCCQSRGGKNGDGAGPCSFCLSPHQQKSACVNDVPDVGVASNDAKVDCLIIAPSSARSSQHVNDLKNDRDTYEPVDYNEIPKSKSPLFDELQTNSGRQPLTRNHCTHCKPNECMDGDIVMIDDGLALKELAVQCDISSPSGVKQTSESERQAALTASDCFVSVENKELHCKLSEEYSLKDDTSISGKRRPSNLEKTGFSFVNPGLSLGKATSDDDQLCSGNQWPETSDISDKGDERSRLSAETDDYQRPDAEPEKSGSLLTELLKISQDNADAWMDCEISEASEVDLVSEFKKVETKNAICAILGNIKQLPAQEYLLSCIEGDVSFQNEDLPPGDGDLVTCNGCWSFGDNLPIDRRFRNTSIESWPQLKKRNIEHEQNHSFSSSLSFRVRKPQSSQGVSPGPCLKSIELNVDTALVDRYNNSFDNETCQEINSNLIEVTGSSFSSQCEEVGFAHNKKNKHGSSLDSVSPQQFEGAITSGLTEEANNSGRCVVEGIRTSFSNTNEFDATALGDGQVGFAHNKKNKHRSSLDSVSPQQFEGAITLGLTEEANNSGRCVVEGIRPSFSNTNEFDATALGDGQVSQHSCNLQISDNLNTEKATLTMKMIEGSKSPNLQGQRQDSVLSPRNADLELIDDDQSIPDFEGFLVDAQTESVERDFSTAGIDFDKLNLPTASFLAEICKSASMITPSSHFSSAIESQGTKNLFHSVPKGLLEHLKFGNTLPLNLDAVKQIQSGSSPADDNNFAFERMPYFDCLPCSGSLYGSSSKIQHASPLGKLQDRLPMHTWSSGKSFTSNPELTCFPIEEDPSNSEENNDIEEHEDDVQGQADSTLSEYGDKRQPLKDLTNLDLDSCPVSADDEASGVHNLDFLSAELSSIKKKDEIPLSSKDQHRLKSETRKLEDSSIGATHRRITRSTSVVTNGIKQAKESINSIISKSNLLRKPSFKRQHQKHSLKEFQGNNIVSNINSFIPLIQRKPAASICAGKKEIKVKALEAAEVSKHLAEKKEAERKRKKEALKLERAKLEEKNMRQMELKKKKNEDERKKKSADIIVKKRLREEEEKKEKESKRLRLETRQRQRDQEKKVQVEKAEKGKQPSNDGNMNNKKGFHDVLKMQSNKDASSADERILRKTEPILIPTEVVLNYEECGISGQSSDTEKALNTEDKSPKNENLIRQNGQGMSYEISPYNSDDEEDETDVLPTKKYIPAWASISVVAILVPLQQEMDPDIIFPAERFCSMDEVLIPRKLQQKQMAS